MPFSVYSPRRGCLWRGKGTKQVQRILELVVPEIKGTLSKDDDDDGSENVVKKKWICVNSNRNRIYLGPLNMSNVGDFPRSWILKDFIQVQKEEGKFPKFVFVCPRIVNGGDWLWSPANIKGANKDAKIYVRRSTTLHNLLFCVHTLCMNYVTSTFLLVSSSVRSKQLLCFVQGQGQKREQKHTTKNFVGFHNHSLY